jgi:hypothetical protein
MEKVYLKKEEVAQILAIPGNVKGTVILTNIEYLRKKGGKEAVEKLKNRIKELEIPIDLERVEHASMYPEAVSVLIILLIKEILNLDEKGIFEMGEAAVKLSPIVKTLTKFFKSLDVVLKKASEYWKEYFDFGELEVGEYNKEKKYAIIRIKGYKFHPLICIYLAGNIYQVAKLASGSQKIAIEERKCVFKGDHFHEFYVSWE